MLAAARGAAGAPAASSMSRCRTPRAAASHGPGREEFFIEHHHVFSPASLAMLAAGGRPVAGRLERLREPSTKFTAAGVPRRPRSRQEPAMSSNPRDERRPPPSAPSSSATRPGARPTTTTTTPDAPLSARAPRPRAPHGGRPRRQVLLDAGCGPASMLRHLAAPGRSLYGFDLTPEMVAEARRVMAEQAACRPQHVWEGSVLTASRLHAAGAAAPAYDAVVCFGVLPHMPEAADAVVHGQPPRRVAPGRLRRRRGAQRAVRAVHAEPLFTRASSWIG